MGDGRGYEKKVYTSRGERDTVPVSGAYRQIQGKEERRYEKEAVISSREESCGATTRGIVSE